MPVERIAEPESVRSVRNAPLQVGFAVALAAAIALASLFAAQVIPLHPGGFLPESFVTHSVMLGLSLAAIWILSRGRPALFGLTWGGYRFRPGILLWCLPTAALSLLAALAPGEGGGPAALEGLSRLRTILFVWIYASICEEVLTRGLLQSLLDGTLRRVRRPSRRISLPVAGSALFFGAMHLVLVPSMGSAAAPIIILAVFLGLVAGRYREKTGSLAPAVIVHALFNVGGMVSLWAVQWLRG